MSDVSYAGPLSDWLAQAPQQPPPRVMGKSPAKLLAPYLGDPDQAQAAAEAAATRVRAPYAKANARESGLPQIGEYFGNKLASALMAPRDALTGTLQVTDPETGMPTREAMERGQGVANLAMTGGLPFARQGAAGMAGGKLAQPGGGGVESAVGRTAEMMTQIPERRQVVHASPSKFENFQPASALNKHGTYRGEENWIWFGDPQHASTLADQFGGNAATGNVHVAETTIPADLPSVKWRDYDQTIGPGDRPVYDPETAAKILNEHKGEHGVAIRGVSLTEHGKPMTIYAIRNPRVIDAPRWREDPDIPLKEPPPLPFSRTNEGPPERIIGASYTAGGKHYVAPNHVLAMDQAVKDLGLTGTSDLVDLHGGFEGHHAANGFMTSTGRVVNRAEADRIASAAEQGQSTRPGSLKSEDMSDDWRIGFSSAGAQRGSGAAGAANKLTPEELAAAQTRSADYQARLKARLANKPAAEPTSPSIGGERIGFKSLDTDKK